MADSIFDFDPIAANNTSFAGTPYGPNQLYHNQIDNLFRAYAGALGGFVDDLGAVATPTGTATAIAVTLSQGFTGYGTAAGEIRHGTLIALKMPLAATAAATLAVNAIAGTKKIRRQGDAAIEANDWLANGVYFFRYDTAYDTAAGAWVLMNAASSGVTFATNAAALLASSTTTSITPANRARDLRNSALNGAYLSKVYADIRRGINTLWDGFATSNGVNAARSANYTVDTSGKKISPTSVAATAVPGATGSIIGNLLSAGAATPFDGTTSQSDAQADYQVNTGSDGATVGKDWGLGNTKTIYAFRVYGSNNSGLWQSSASNTIKLQGSTDNFASSNVTLYSGTSTDANGLVADITSGITTSTAYRYHRVAITGNGTENVYVAQIVFYDAAATINNMTYSTTVQTASASCSTVVATIEIDPITSVTLGTDLTAIATCNNWSNSVSGTLTNVGTGQSGRTVVEATFTGLTAGTSFAAEWVYANNKNGPIYASEVEAI